MAEWTEVTVSIPNWEWETYAIVAYSLIAVIVFMGLVRIIPVPFRSYSFNDHVIIAVIVAIVWLPALGITLPLYLLVKIARIGKDD